MRKASRAIDAIDLARLAEAPSRDGGWSDQVLVDSLLDASEAPIEALVAAAHEGAGVEGLILAAFDADALGPDLTWEPSRGGALFPHLYAPLRLADVLWHKPLPLVDGAHVFPELD